ncbi:MAG: integrase core domain-containing protein [Limisphaerales bacterium]
MESVRLPARSPNLNAIAERFVRSIKESCLDRIVFIGQASLQRASLQFVLHYHGERNHRGWETRSSSPNPRLFQVGVR